MGFISFHNLSEADRVKATETLITQSTPTQDFFFMITLSILMATFGILINSMAVVIGSMLVAPLLSPILSVALGIILADAKLIQRSVKTILKSTGIGITASVIVTLFFASEIIAPEMLQNLEPSFLYMGVAIVAGFAATFALIKPQLNATLPGAAVAVALVPPLALIGVGIAKFNWEIVTNSLAIFTLNLIGIIFASMITFSLMNFYREKGIAREAIIEEEEKLEEEKIVEKLAKEFGDEDLETAQTISTEGKKGKQISKA